MGWGEKKGGGRRVLPFGNFGDGSNPRREVTAPGKQGQESQGER